MTATEYVEIVKYIRPVAPHAVEPGDILDALKERDATLAQVADALEELREAGVPAELESVLEAIQELAEGDD